MATTNLNWGTGISYAIPTKDEINNKLLNVFGNTYSDDGYAIPTKSELIKIFNISNTVASSYASDQLVPYNDISIKSLYTINVRVWNKRGSGVVNLEKIILYNGSTEIGSKKSGFSDISNGSYKDYSINVSSSNGLESNFKLEIGTFLGKRNLKFSDANGTIDMGSAKSFSSQFSFSPAELIYDNYGKNFTFIIYVYDA